MTISDIAKMAGVSSAAVSRYLNGGPLSEQKRTAIREDVEKTGYHPDSAAQTLRTGKVRQELYKGNLINAGVWSPYSLYREDIATFAAGGDYKQSDATGFISIYGLPTKVQAIVNSEKEGE